MLAIVELFRFLPTFFPPDMRMEIERDLPAMTVALRRLALEVLDAEVQGLRYIDAIEQPTYPLMARVHHGVLDLLQWRFPPRVLDGLRTICRSAARGDFDPMRKVLFAIAGRKNDPDAALARFLIFQAIRVNVYLWTWDEPEVEAWGCVHELEDEAQGILDQFLAVPEVHEEGIRPLHVLMSEVLLRLTGRAMQVAMRLREHVGAVIEDMVHMTDATRVVRALDAADAAVFRPGRSTESLGSQRIRDRFPWHFPSPNAVEQRRSRLRRKLDSEVAPEPSGGRFVDMLLDELKAEGDR